MLTYYPAVHIENLVGAIITIVRVEVTFFQAKGAYYNNNCILCNFTVFLYIFMYFCKFYGAECKINM